MVGNRSGSERKNFIPSVTPLKESAGVKKKTTGRRIEKRHPYEGTC